MLIKYQYFSFYGIRELEQAINEAPLKYYASDILEEIGVSGQEQLCQTVKRAILALFYNHINVRKHIKPVYRIDFDSVFLDYKMSPVAAYFLIVNTGEMSEEIARIQMELIRNLK
jgi:hypothetical protein